MKEKQEAHIYFPLDVFEKLKKLAAKNRRTISAEVVIAVEKHTKKGR